MKVIASAVLVLYSILLWPSATLAINPYGWVLSYSSTNIITTRPPTAGVYSVFLYLLCDESGLTRAQLGVCGSHAPNILAFTPLNGFENLGNLINLDLVATGCKSSPLVAGDFLVLDGDGTGGTLCLCDSTGAQNVAFDCSGSTIPWPVDYIGCSSDGSGPCEHFEYGDELCQLPPIVGPNEYGWTISSSNTDPYKTTGPRIQGFFTLYLWLTCNSNDGALDSEFSVAGTLNLLSFSAASMFTNLGSTTDLRLIADECAQAPVIAGSWWVFDQLGNGGNVCFAPSSNGKVVTGDCNWVTPGEWDHDYIGFSNDGVTEPCRFIQGGGDSLCAPPATAVRVDIEGAPWANVKSQYRRLNGEW